MVETQHRARQNQRVLDLKTSTFPIDAERLESRFDAA